jgi:hypothetical protein
VPTAGKKSLFQEWMVRNDTPSQAEMMYYCKADSAVSLMRSLCKKKATLSQQTFRWLEVLFYQSSWASKTTSSECFRTGAGHVLLEIQYCCGLADYGLLSLPTNST